MNNSQSFVLVLNCGSSSLKFAVIDPVSGDEALTGLAECLGNLDARISWKLDGKKSEEALAPGGAHREAIEFLVDLIQKHGLDKGLIAVGHRVVQGAERFTKSVLIDKEVVDGIKAISNLAILHNPANLMGVHAAQRAFPKLPQVAVFDTAFHQTMPDHAYMYALPKDLYTRYGIRRYGAHGTSHFYVASEAACILGKPLEETNVITAHLGNGASVCAVKNGKSVDTSMGMTPLEGLVMGTRSGDIDPSIPDFLATNGYSPQEVNTILNRQSGLLGISGLSNDFRTILKGCDEGHKGALLAYEMFCYRLAKYIAGYMIPLQRIDALVFTGGIGENSFPMRKRVMELLAVFGYQLDEEANRKAMGSTGGQISTPDSPMVLVIPTNEEWVIAKEAAALAKNG